jgi:hypothetical protein
MTDSPSEADGWRRVATDPPSSTTTLIFPVEMTDGTAIWRTTTGQVPPEDDVPLWWRFAQEADNG